MGLRLIEAAILKDPVRRLPKSGYQDDELQYLTRKFYECLSCTPEDGKSSVIRTSEMVEEGTAMVTSLHSPKMPCVRSDRSQAQISKQERLRSGLLRKGEYDCGAHS